MVDSGMLTGSRTPIQLWGSRHPCWGRGFLGAAAPGDNPSPELSLVPIGLQWNLTVWFVVGKGEGVEDDASVSPQGEGSHNGPETILFYRRAAL